MDFHESQESIVILKSLVLQLSNFQDLSWKNFQLQQRSKILLWNFDKGFKGSTKEHKGVLRWGREKGV